MAKKNVIEVVISGKDEASKVLKSFSGNVTDLGKVATAAAAVAVGAMVGIGAGIAKLAIDAAPLEGIESAYGALAERIGTSSDVMLAKMEEASAGMISQREIMKQTNVAAALVGDTFAETLPDAMEVMTKAAAAQGTSVDYMMDSYVRGVGRVSPLILDNLGVQMDMNAALEAYAEKHGIKATQTTIDHSEAITDLNEKLGFQQTELAMAESALKNANDELALGSTYYAEGSVDLQNFKDRVASAQLAVDKKTAAIGKTNEKLAELQTAHGTVAESGMDWTEVLTKEQQQMALSEQVIGKLGEKYADMPPVTDSLATSVAAMQAKFQNFKDQAGKAFIPVVGEIIGKLAELADRVMPLVTGFIEDPFVPFLEKLATAFGFVFDQVMAGQFDFEAFRDVLGTLLPQEIVDRIYSLATSVLDLVETVKPYIEMAMDWIAQNVTLQDALIALGVAIATFVVPLVVGLASPLLTLVATFAVLTAAITILRHIWETDWMGIRTALTDFWENTAQPALSQLWEWLQVNVPIAIQTLSDFWMNILLPALQTAWIFIQESILPIFATLWAWLQESLPLAIQILSDYWNLILLPALKMVWAFIQEYVIPLFLALGNIMDAVLGLATTVLAGLWQNVLWPALEMVWAFIQDNVIPIFESLTAETEDRLGPTLVWLNEKVLVPLKDIFEKVKEIIKKLIDKANDLADAIRNIDLGPLTPGSPSPFELSLAGIADTIKKRTLPAVRELSGMIADLGAVGGEFAIDMAGAGYGAGATNVSNQRVTTSNLTMNVYTRATAASVVQDFETLRALEG